ncbi:MAG TPA: sulfurtransferase TusA family protein [Candidatus Limnocylindrales bacterium]|jgi:tRNA 2-thiouridine synthesizing protein A|nr:sulfurtransferase TusA family protein [Candidatus Limnocylindrales bacterium]
MIESPAHQPVGRLIDARGSYCPGPLMELIRVIREAPVGEYITLRSSDRGSRVDIPKWLEKAGHRLVSIDQLEGYDEIVIEKLH